MAKNHETGAIERRGRARPTPNRSKPVPKFRVGERVVLAFPKRGSCDAKVLSCRVVSWTNPVSVRYTVCTLTPLPGRAPNERWAVSEGVLSKSHKPEGYRVDSSEDICAVIDPAGNEIAWCESKKNAERISKALNHN